MGRGRWTTCCVSWRLLRWASWTGGALSEARGGGRGALQLSLDIPLNRGEDTRVKGLVTLVDKDQAEPATEPVDSGVRGLARHHCPHGDAAGCAGRTRVWGQEMVVQGKRGQDGVVRFSARGSMSAEGLKQAQEYPALARLAPHLSGETPVSVTVAAGARTEVQVSSTLQGIGAALPAPLTKPAAAVWPLTVTYRTEGERGQQDLIQVDVGNPQALAMTPAALPRVRVDLRRDVSAAEARGHAGAHQPGAGLARAGGSHAALARTWGGRTLVESHPGPGRVAEGGRRLPWPVGGGGASQSDLGDGAPETVSIQTGALTFRQRTLKDVSATLAHPAPNVWRLQLNADQVAGQIEWAPEKAPLAAGPSSTRVTARCHACPSPMPRRRPCRVRRPRRCSPARAASQLPAWTFRSTSSSGVAWPWVDWRWRPSTGWCPWRAARPCPNGASTACA